MSFVFSMNREKRTRSSTGESNSSFVKNVTSRVSGLLPAGITKWFSSPSSSSANGSVANADGTDSSTEDEAPESPMMQPPAKRLRYSSPVGKYSQLTTSETTLTSNIITETGSVLYNSIQSPHGLNTFRRETDFISTPIRGQAEDINVNTMMDRSERENPYRQHTVSAIGQSIALKRKSLFDTDKQKEQSLIACAKTAAHQVQDASQPHFKPHLFGSPFYPGRTMYGGASASSTYINQPNIKQRKVTCVNESKDSVMVNMSTSSRRVMDLLENYSSPLIEAKRIPRYELSELGDINQKMQPSTSMRQSYKTQELYIPSTASIIRMKARSRLMDSTKAARQIIASHSSTLTPHKPYAVGTLNRDDADDDLGPAKSQSKLKSRLTRLNRGEDPFGMPEPVELPTATLQIDKNNLPKFSFGGSIPKSTQTSIAITQSNEALKFSSPLPITAVASKTSLPSPGFDFCSPNKAAMKTSPSKFSEVTKKPDKTEEPAKIQNTEKTAKAVAKVSNDWKCSDCWISNKSDAQKCVCCGAKQPSKKTAPTATETMPKCTVCKLANSQANSDKCINCEKMRSSLKTANNLLPATTKVGSSKWKCSECWVYSEETADKCVCCGSRNPVRSAPPAQVPLEKEVLATVTVAKDWRCEECFITNKPSVQKCAACGGTKPGMKPAQKTLPSITPGNLNKDTDSKLAEIVKSQKSCWECRVCLASNANDKIACVCCDADRDGQDNGAPKFKNFKFNTEPNPGFKFGIDPKVQETNLAKKVEETPKPKNSEESETNNNIVPKVPSYTFTLPPKKSGDKLDGTKTDEEPKPYFSFGIPEQNATHIATGFILVKVPSPTKIPVNEKPDEVAEKPQEVPTISFKALEAANSPTGQFQALVPKSNPQNAMNAFLDNSEETKKAVSPNKKPLSVPLETSKSQFSFPAVKPSTGGLFSTPAPATTSNSLTTQAAPATTPVMEMFSKAETSVTAAAPFFPKAETTPTPSTVFQNNVQSNPAPMFSFGNNQSANLAPATDTKKYNFSFGSGTTTTPAFGAAPQTNSTFSLSTDKGPSIPLGGNGIANPLGGSGGNGLTTSGNVLGSSSTPMFNAPATENTNMWPNSTELTNQANPFMTSTPAKPAFSFGATPAPFGAQANNAQVHLFGASPQPAQSMFGISQNNDGQQQQSMFPNPAASAPAPMFGASQPPNPAHSMEMFGATNATPFGSSTPSMPTFNAPSPAPAQASAFNFGTPQASPGVFGFGQQAQPAQQSQMQQSGMQQMQLAGMFSFGGAAAPAGPVQFNMGSAPSATAGRRVRKAVRRNPQR